MGSLRNSFVTNSRYDVENNGRVDGKIPVKDFEKILEENVLWVEKVPADVRANIIALTDMDGDGYVSQEEFLQLANGRNIPGFNRRRRRALRELLKQTVEFIVSHSSCRQFIMYEKCRHSMVNGFILNKS